MPVGSDQPDETKTVATEGGDEFPCGERSKSTVVDRDDLHCNRDTGLLQTNFRDFDGAAGTLRWFRLSTRSSAPPITVAVLNRIGSMKK